MSVIVAYVLGLLTAARQWSPTNRMAASRPEKPDSELSSRLQEAIERQRRLDQDRQYRLQRHLVIATWSTFGAAFVYAAITLGVWHATREAADAARKATQAATDALKRSQRPWVSVISAELVDPVDLINGGQNFVAMIPRIAITNSGPSIARNGMIQMYLEPNSGDIAEQNWKKPCDRADMIRGQIARGEYKYPIGFVLAPGEKRDALTGPTQGTDLAPNEARLGRFWLFGCAAYDDQFGITHHTKFCFTPLPPPNGIYKSGDFIKFRRCDAFEEAD